MTYKEKVKTEIRNLADTLFEILIYDDRIETAKEDLSRLVVKRQELREKVGVNLYGQAEYRAIERLKQEGIEPPVDWLDKLDNPLLV